MTQPKVPRRARILRTAETMFAAHGYEAVAMRDIATRADVSVALLTYHFETKENLYRTIFSERQPVLDERIEQLRAIPADAPDRIEQIIDAFIGPQMQLRASPDGLAFAQMVAREATDPSAENRDIISGLYDPLAREFISALADARPDLPLETIRWYYLFAVGAISMSALDARVARFGGHPDLPLEEKTAILRQFLVASLSKHH